MHCIKQSKIALLISKNSKCSPIHIELLNVSNVRNKLTALMELKPMPNRHEISLEINEPYCYILCKLKTFLNLTK